MTLQMLVRSVWQHVPNVLMDIAVIVAKNTTVAHNCVCASETYDSGSAC